MSILGTLVTDFKKDAGKVKSFLLKIAGDAPAVVAVVVADEQKVAQVLEAFLPQSAVAFQVADQIINLVAQAVEDAGPASAANGLVVKFDQAVVNDVKAVIAAAKLAAKKL